MGRTINRPITSVNTPSKSDVQNYFFTHANWKGLNNDKNFLTVDQETFSECKNVYMDSEGLLKSRPSVKIKTVKVTLDGEEVILSDILECTQFGDVTVYKVKIEFDSIVNYYLIFVPKSAPAFQAICNEKVKLIPGEGKIFVFSENGLKYYDVSTNSYLNAEELIYIPITKTYTEGVWRDFEPANELTTSYMYRYLYDNVIDNVDFTVVYDKRVKVTIDGNSYYIDFVKGVEVLFLEDKRTLNDNNFITIAGSKYPLVASCKTGQFLLSYIENTELSIANRYDIYYTRNGLIFNKLPDISDVIGFPKISSDGNYAICLKADDLYIYSLTDTEDTDVYTQWTPLIQTKNKEFYDEGLPSFGVDSIPEMYNIDNFVIYFTVSSLNPKNRALLVCNDGEYLYKYLSLNNMLQKYDVELTHFYTEDTFSDEIVHVNDFSIDIDDAYSSNIFKLNFENFTVNRETFTREPGTEYDLYTISTSLSGVLHKNDGSSTSKFEQDVTFHFTVSDYSMYDGGPVNYYTNVSFSIFSARIKIEASRAGVNGAKLTLTASEITSNEVIDFEYDGPEYYIENTYQYTPNIACNVTAENLSYLVDVGAVYRVDVTNSSTYCLYSELMSQDLNRLTLMNALRICSDFCEFTKFYKPRIAYYKYEISSASLTCQYLYLSNIKYECKCIFNADGSLITNKFMYTNSAQQLPLLFEVMPIYFNDVFYACTYENLYSNDISRTISVDEVIQGENIYIVPDYVSEIENFYLAVDKTLYISSYPNDGNFKWYLPKISTEQFDYTINNLHPISSTELGVFLDDAIYYIQKTDTTTETGISHYLYYKLQVGCKNGADVITSFDGQYVIFSSSRGLVALTYQQLTASTEQVLTFLSDTIHKTFTDFSTKAIKLYKYDYWIVCYKEGEASLLVFDVRNNSWWPITLPFNVSSIVTIENEPIVLDFAKLYHIDKSETEYYDFDGITTSQIDWNVRSQKLHLDAPNYYKHIVNITLTSVLDDTSRELLNLDLTVTNYRKRANTSDIENFAFDVDAVRVFVKRLNYSKVNEFQYLLQSDEYDVSRTPLSLSSISVKYKISGQVR